VTIPKVKRIWLIIGGCLGAFGALITIGFQSNVIHYNATWRPFDFRPVVPAPPRKHFFIARGVLVEGLDDNVHVPSDAVLLRGVDLNRVMLLMHTCNPSFQLKYCIASKRGIIVEKGAQAPLYAIDPKDFRSLKQCDPNVSIATPDL
jgi:hypothetical protein